MNDFFKKFTQFSMGPILGAFISLITVPLTTHFVLPEEYGKASMFMMVQTLMMSLLVVGLDQAYTREYHVEKNKKNLFYHALSIPLLLSIGLLIVFALNPYFFSYLIFESRSYPGVIILIGVFGIFITVERFVLLNLRMAERAIEFSIFTVLVRILVLLSTLSFVLFIRRDFLAVVFSMIIGQIVGDLILFVRHRKMFSITGFSFDKRLFEKLLKFGLPLVLAVAIGIVLNVFDRIVFRLWIDFEQLGIYTAAMKLVGVLLILSNGFTTFWIPTAYRWHEEGRKAKDYKLVSDGILTVMSLAFVGLLILRPLIVVILSPQYSDAKFLFGFLSLWPIMLMLSETTTLGIVFSRKSYLNIFVSAITAIVCVVANVLLAPRYGAMGVAVSIGLSWVVFFLARTAFSFKVWQGFRVVRQMVVVVLLIFLAFLNTRAGFYVIIVNVVSIPLLLFINRDIVKLGWSSGKVHFIDKKYR